MTEPHYNGQSQIEEKAIYDPISRILAVKILGLSDDNELDKEKEAYEKYNKEPDYKKGLVRIVKGIACELRLVKVHQLSC